MHLIQGCPHGLGVADVGLLEDCDYGNLGSVEISRACVLPICSSVWCDIHESA